MVKFVLRLLPSFVTVLLVSHSRLSVLHIQQNNYGVLSRSSSSGVLICTSE